MEISQKLLCFLFLSSFAAGAAWGLLYDLFYLSRLLLGRSPSTTESDARAMSTGKRIWCAALLFMEDLLFVFFGGLVLILLLYFVNDGQFRFIAMVGMGCGLFVWRVTLGHLFGKISEGLVSLIRRFVRFCLKWLFFPFRILGKCLYTRLLCPFKRRIDAARRRRCIKATEHMIQEFQHQAEGAFEGIFPLGGSK